MMPASGNRQTFPETPPAFSPMFSPGVNHPQGHTVSSGCSSVRRQLSAAQSLRGHGSSSSLKTIVGRSASVGMGMKARRKSLWNRMKRSPASNGPPLRPSLSTVTNDGAATTTKSDQILSGDGLPSRPRSVPNDNSVDHPSSRHPALSGHSELQRKTIIPPTPLGLPPPPPSSSSSSSSLSLPPPPPPPKLHAPAPPFAHVSAASASSLPPPYESLLSTAPDDALGAPSVNPPPNGSDRPPRPLGPRALRNSSSSPNSRERILSHGSAASLSRVTLMGARELVSGGSTSLSGPNSSSGPRFRTSPPKFKALTMEGAKWTFSSEELQEIVSQAIKQSGRSSSIRLSSLQEACVEIPEELERLDALMHELGVQYRLQVRKRDVLLRAAYACTESPESSSIALRAKLQELHETSVNLDRIAEDLYHARDQAAQISRMLTVHSRSALAMALRKLHSSFLKRTTEVDTLKDRVATLEAERDEAWAQAQEVARDLDALNDTIQSRASTPCLTRSTSRRSSRVMASRKSSLRVSKAGLRLSQRASTASQMARPR
ncbi:hypothetical protein BC826DRAFT_556233 [Russula brevipes]|nr:hypothetical protein BC826DRAFT_556233 [Russula brevipes]